MTEDTLEDMLKESTTYRHESIESRLEDHDERISRNEQFRYTVIGAITVLSIIIGSGLTVLFFTNFVLLI